MTLSIRDNLSSIFFGCTYVLPLIAVADAVRCSDPLPALHSVFVTLAITMLLIGGPMSCCLHRFFAHSAFSTSRAFRFVLAVASTFAYQRGPIWWASKHRKHHKLCDGPGDPHSPAQLGFWMAFVGWTLDPSEQQIDRAYVAHLSGAWELELIEKVWFLFPLVAFVGARCFGPSPAAIFVSTPLLLCRLITLLFNIEFHKTTGEDSAPPAPSAPSPTCCSQDIARFLGDLVGEAAHSHHHRHPKALRRPSLGPPNIDVPYFLFIVPLLRVRLIQRSVCE